VLVSGHHAEVAKWRRLQSLRRTLQRRPDLFVRAAAQGFVTLDDIKLLVSL
jgi:tRNA (guanine37-N1)-methyltransferase